MVLLSLRFVGCQLAYNVEIIINGIEKSHITLTGEESVWFYNKRKQGLSGLEKR